MKKDVIVGIHAISEWLEANPARLETVLQSGQGGERARRVVEQARAAGIAVERIDPKALRRLAEGRNPQGVAATVHPFPFASLDDVVEGAPSNARLLAVDGVTDPGNLGAIIRSAAFFGLNAVLLPRDRSAAITSVVERSAAGGAARIAICQENSLLRSAERLKKRGFRVMGAIVGPHPAPAELDFDGPILAIVGSEGRGIRPSLRRICDMKTSLPSLGPASLNVSAFTSILLYEIWRQDTARNGR